MATVDLLAEIRDTIRWCEDWEAGLFAPAPTPDGWTVEMHGLVDGLLDALPAVVALIEAARARSGEDGFCVICLHDASEHEPYCALAPFVSTQEAAA